MKKLIITCAILLIGTYVSTAQTRVRQQSVRTTTTTKTRTTQATSTPSPTAQQPLQSPAVSTVPQPRSATTPTDMQLQNGNKTVPANSDIIVPDHAYEPKGTEGVGVYGNQTGGSSIGSTNTTNGGTIKNADNSKSTNTTGTGAKVR